MYGYSTRFYDVRTKKVGYSFNILIIGSWNNNKKKTIYIFVQLKNKKLTDYTFSLCGRFYLYRNVKLKKKKKLVGGVGGGIS